MKRHYHSCCSPKRKHEKYRPVDILSTIPEEPENDQVTDPSIHFIPETFPNVIHYYPVKPSAGYAVLLPPKKMEIPNQIISDSTKILIKQKQNQISQLQLSTIFISCLGLDLISRLLFILKFSLFITGIVMLGIALSSTHIFGLAVSLSTAALGLSMMLQLSVYILQQERKSFQPKRESKQLSILDIKREPSILAETNNVIEPMITMTP